MAGRIFLAIGYFIIVVLAGYLIREGVLGIILLLNLGESIRNSMSLVMAGLALFAAVFLPLEIVFISRRRRTILIVGAGILSGFMAVMLVLGAVAALKFPAPTMVTTFLWLLGTTAAQAAALVYFLKSRFLKNQIAARAARAREKANQIRPLPPLG
jgi:hypothetical protein